MNTLFIETRGNKPRLKWESILIKRFHFELCNQKTIKAKCACQYNLLTDLIIECRQALQSLSYEIAFHGLSAHEFNISHYLTEENEVKPIQSFDIVLHDNKIWIGMPIIPCFDIGFARDYWIENILISRNDKAEKVKNSIPLLKSIESLLRAIVYPQHELFHTYLVVDYIKKDLGKSISKIIGINNLDIKYITRMANSVPDFRSRHAHNQINGITEMEITECLFRARKIIKGYCEHLELQ